jgi:shikimate kinase
MTKAMNLYLIGYRCTGKTTVGKALAQRLGWPFSDMDRLIVETAGTRIDRMVAEKGWPYFREQERRALAALTAADRQVVATGGGIVLDARNVRDMQGTGKIVWLTAAEATIRTRMLADASTADNRPPLTGQGLIDEIVAVLAERRPLYQEAADITVDTDRETIAGVCERIVGILGLERKTDEG